MAVVKVLGEVDIVVEGSTIAFGKPLLLFLYPVLVKRRCSREELERIIGKEIEDGTKMGNYIKDVSLLDHRLRELLDIDPNSIEVRPKAALWVDVDVFRRLSAEIVSSIEAKTPRIEQKHDVPRLENVLVRLCSLYRGPLLQDITHSSKKYSRELHEWLDAERNRLNSSYCELLVRAADHFLLLDERNLALRYCKKLLGLLSDADSPLSDSEFAQLDEWSMRLESAHRLMMRIWARSGLIDEAEAQYKKLTEILHGVFHREPAYETEQLLKDIRNGKHTAKIEQMDEQAPPRGTVRQRGLVVRRAQVRGAGGIPQRGIERQSGSVGRDADVAALCQMIASGRRLVTLVGLGGIGKTTLARSVASKLSSLFTEGARDVYLVAAETPEAMLSLVALSLGIEVLENVTDAHIAEIIGNRHMLLVLDNLEQVLSSSERAAEMVATFVATLLRKCTNLHILATSRERLVTPKTSRLFTSFNVEEDVYHVKPLTLTASVELFLRHIDPSIAITESGKVMIAELCHDLDGWPLAIQIVASSLRSESQLPSIRDSILTAMVSRPGTPLRHASIEAAVAWSYGLLTEAQKRLFLGLGVFEPGFDVKDVRAVLGASWLHPGETDVNSLVAALVNKSLAQVDESGLQLHPLVSEFARSYVLSDDLALLKRLHASHFAIVLAMIDEITHHKARTLEALGQFDRKRTNIDAAWMYLLEAYANDASNPKINNLLCRYALATERIGPLRYSSAQWIRLLEAAIVAVDSAPAMQSAEKLKLGVLLADAYCGNERLDDAQQLDDMNGIRKKLAERAERAYKRAKDRAGEDLLTMWNRIGDAYSLLGRKDFAAGCYDKVLKNVLGPDKEMGSLPTTEDGRVRFSPEASASIRACLSLGYLYAQDQEESGRDRALKYYDRSLLFAQQINDERGVALAQWYKGLVEVSRGNLAKAVELMQALVQYETNLNHPNTARDRERLLQLEQQLGRDGK